MYNYITYIIIIIYREKTLIKIYWVLWNLLQKWGPRVQQDQDRKLFTLTVVRSKWLKGCSNQIEVKGVQIAILQVTLIFIYYFAPLFCIFCLILLATVYNPSSMKRDYYRGSQDNIASNNMLFNKGLFYFRFLFSFSYRGIVCYFYLFKNYFLFMA